MEVEYRYNTNTELLHREYSGHALDHLFIPSKDIPEVINVLTAVLYQQKKEVDAVHF